MVINGKQTWKQAVTTPSTIAIHSTVGLKCIRKETSCNWDPVNTIISNPFLAWRLARIEHVCVIWQILSVRAYNELPINKSCLYHD